MSSCPGRRPLPKVVKIAGLWVMLYSGEQATGYASGANGGSIPIVFPQLSNREKSKAPEQEKRNSTKCGLFGGLCRLTPQ